MGRQERQVHQDTVIKLMPKGPANRIIVDTLKQGHPVGWPGPTTSAAAEVISSNVLTDMITRVIVDTASPDVALKG